ncbi:MAG: CDP-diacylglycerol--serine O-phosphatidyltransferase [Gammaproteobacteria bacterium]|nr:CDP-diacylglycerol--serine O-phosphatidyltransferase [Gammaproteobacteria bacterium]
MSPESETESQRPRGIYLLPNLFTTANLFAGFYAILAATSGKFEVAAIAIFVAMIMDSLDGRVARMTNTQSAFGAEYDSLSDMVAFGLAPSLVMFHWALTGLGKFGWVAAFIYTACAALRLARFNTQLGSADKRYFQGLPSPAAAAIVAGMVWVGVDQGAHPLGFSAFLLAVLTLTTGLLMISNFRFHSFKEVNWKGKVPFVAVIPVILVFAFVFYDPPTVLFSVFFLYALSGPVLTLWQIKQRRQVREEGSKTEADKTPEE